ncbi:hypothetical protein [Ectopseudomonas mendocina]|jgi:hypothetical protein|uniref:Lipoprotein n=2 Tax=Ectopseudomonas mendocina TaxID=300 RepID=A0A379IV96_ECTME|nr:hypothetical protein [Pseudomonas mendocina]MBL0952487.1 hypothetical protein [Pseudomonas sp.]AEB58447.1 hypothetical protein MDS_2416 [Pseudomonas mendocina NK-01]ALN19342.1 hypothetical protein DW68_012110 [Pseudomonas mendocina S5.2]KER99780.1 hypothetical protein HN51_08035 [Pseudomonas mendocina]MDF2073239.1 hypothetical protein [Pseudomonas mendocina]
MRSLAIAALACSAATVFAAPPTPPSPTQIAAWSPEEINEMGPSIDKLLPITLKGGEQAYLASVSYENAGRNFWAGYLLVRPQIGEARPLDEFGGQYNQIRTLDEYSTSHSAVIIGGAGSGQGTSESSYSLVVFDGWAVKTLFSASESDNSGNCGAYVERDCSGNRVFINVFEGDANSKRVGLLVSNLQYSSPDIEATPYEYSQETEILFLDNPNQ